MKNTVGKWVANPKRSYATGVELFKTIAPAAMQNRYISYFDAGDDAVRQNMLLSKLRALHPGIPADMVCQKSKQKKSQVVIPVTLEVINSTPETFSEDDLTDEQREWFDRIKTIRPLQAAIHAEILAENNDVKRASLVSELLNLEGERKALWDKIDGNSPIPEQDAAPKDLVAEIAALIKRQNQLKQNIGRGKCSEEAMEAYKKELDEITVKLDGKKS